MKLIRTMVRTNKVGDVREALGRLPIASMTVTELCSPGHTKQPGARQLGGGPGVPVLSNASIEFVVRDEVVADVIVTITRAARMDGIGDGHVSVFPLDHEGYLLAGERDVV